MSKRVRRGAMRAAPTDTPEHVRKPLSRAVAQVTIVVSEHDVVRSWPADWLLTLALDFECMCDGRRFGVTTRSATHAAARAAGIKVVGPNAWRALATAAAEGRAALALSQWLVPALPPPRPPTPPDWTLAPQALLAHLGPADDDLRPARGLTVGATLAHFGAELVALDWTPAAPSEDRL